MDQHWIKIPNTNGEFFISEAGLVKEKTGRLLRLVENDMGYLYVNLKIAPRKYRKVFVHRLLGELFIDNPDNYKYVQHKDNNTYNNSPENLIWVKYVKPRQSIF